MPVKILLSQIPDQPPAAARYAKAGNLYYTGRFAPAGLSDAEEGFGPLDDFGKPNAGAVTIKYNRADGWETL
jgi:hypothetical protein